MERTVLEHEIKTEYKKIREIRTTYVTNNGVERLWDTNRGNLVEPGALDITGENYIQTNTSSYSSELQDLATLCWTASVQTDFEAYLRAQ